MIKGYILNNGFEIPYIGYGTFPHKNVLENTIPIAYQNRYRMFDTSDNYHNEEYVGNAVQELDDCITISKFSQPYRTGELSNCFDESVKRIGPTLKIYLLHWPYPFLWKTEWRKMEELYEEGKVAAIGVCNFDVKHMKRLLRFAKVSPAINQFERHPLFQQKEVYQFCMDNDIRVMSYSPMARFDENLVKNEFLMQLASKYHKTVGQIILRWNIECGCIPIPASSSEMHIKENIDVFDFSLTEEEVDKINSMDIGYRIRYDPAKRFSYKEKIYFLVTKIKLMLVH